MKVYGLIVAGGRGTRFGGPTPKQYLDLAGEPLLVRTLRVFEACPVIDTIVLAVPASDLPLVRESLLPAAHLTKKILLAAGGPSRQDSVFNGLASINEDESLVVIHDAVRPLVTCACIAACVETARQHGACTAAVPAMDTLKQATAAGTVEATLPREKLWLAQTPQAFRTGLIRSAHERARRQQIHGTDDACLVEQMGTAVHLVPGSRRNFKITTEEDLALAAALLEVRDTPVEER
ncbi:MAG: 2-C-methyl-D-erythritol 4-phosphate cytidylyltransferase [Hyphomicrobiales bacterium]